MRDIIIAVMLLLAIAACEQKPASHVDSNQRMLVRQVSGLDFPQSTEYLFFDYVQEQKSAVFAKLGMPVDDAAELLRQPPLAGAEWSDVQRFVPELEGQAEWTPTAVNPFRAQQFQLPGDEILNVLIDDSRDDYKVFYLHWHQASSNG